LLTVGGSSAEIDLGLVGLIEATWALGLRTEFSCEDSRSPDSDHDEPWAYVSFRDVDDFRRFLSCFDGTVLSERRFATPYLFDPATGTRRPVHRRGWKRGVYVKELEPGQTPDGPGEFRMPARLGFAAADIPEMERILRAIVEATVEHVESNVPATGGLEQPEQAKPTSPRAHCAQSGTWAFP